jgi:beta-glucanase (GH16 family)
VNGRFDGGFHTFAVEWSVNQITYLVDDIPYQKIAPGDVTGDWVFNHAFYVILNLAVGGDYVGAPDASTSFPQTMLVDYVRVYKAAP